MALDSESFNRFFDLVEVANFEIASDAFASFKVRQQRKGAWGYEPQQAAAPRSARGMQQHFAPGSSCVVLLIHCFCRRFSVGRRLIPCS